MTNPDHNLAFSRVLAGALATLGLRHVCISPGSRNTPLTLAFAEHPDLIDWSHHDERSAAFFALGLAKAGGDPVALVCTSGTAAAEYLPAVTEARLARVPLLVLTADRPPELRQVGAPQTIDQIRLYGDAVKWFHETGLPDTETIRTAPALAAHTWGEAVDAPAGPVHLNIAFREPLLSDDYAAHGGSSTRPPAVHLPARRPSPESLAEMVDLVTTHDVLFVAGALPPDAAAPIADLARSIGALTLADPQSGLRSDAGGALATGELLVAAGALDLAPPQVVVRWGPLPTSKPIWRWLADHPEVPQIVVDPSGHRDPLASASHMFRSDPAATASDLLTTLTGADFESGDPATTWIDRWAAFDSAASTALALSLTEESFPNEPAIASVVWESAPDGSMLFLGSSMPIRDVDSFAGARSAPVHVLANRGASGIDGTVAAALGATASDRGRPGIALIGDVAVLHDLGSLATMARLGLPLTLVVVHNDGGGIFGLLDQADPRRVPSDIYERHIGTPHGVDFVAVATALGLDAIEVTTREALAEAVSRPVSGPLVVQIRTDRTELAPRRRRLLTAVVDVLPSQSGPGGTI